MKNGEQFLVGRFILLPDHTAGSMGYLWDDIFFVGDAVKYGSEFISGKVGFVYYDQRLADESLDKVKRICRIVIPGHDAPFIKRMEGIEYTSKQVVQLNLNAVRGNDLQIKG